MRSRVAVALAIGILPVCSLQAVTFNHVVSLGDSLLDDTGSNRSPVVAEHVANLLGVPLTKYAKSGSTSSALIDQGQHTQAAANFGAGDLAVLWVGGNDFFYSIGLQFGISAGNYGAINTLEDNVDSILGTLRGAGMDVLMLNLPDISEVPFTDTLTFFDFQLQNVAAATVEWNQRLDSLAAQYGAAVVDVYDLFGDLTASPESFALRGNTPVLGDNYGCQFCVFYDSIHPGSYAQGYIANAAIDAVNSLFQSTGGADLSPLSTVELATLAGLQASDFDGDQSVTRSDLTVWQNAYGNSEAGDADGDRDTDGADLLLWQRQVTFPVAALNVPEPASVALVVACLVLTLLKRSGLFG